mgnify:CR=1 FL=1
MQAVWHRLIELHTRRGATAQSGPPASTLAAVFERLREIVAEPRAYNPRAGQALLASVLAHTVLFLLFAQVMMPGGSGQLVQELRAWVIDDEEELLPEEPLLALAEPAEREAENVLSAEALASAPIVAEQVELDPVLEETVDIEEYDLELPPTVEPIGFERNDLLVTAGSVGEEVDHVDGAVDRITHEIATRLERNDVLVLWLMDASISLVDDREMVAERLERVYREIEELGAVEEDSLVASVVAYGQEVRSLVDPTSSGAEIVAAMRSVEADPSGSENVFQALLWSLDRYQPLITRERRTMMAVVWTDESGDDVSFLEPAARRCQQLAVPVFIVGPASMFGREMGTHAYTHPEDGEVYQLPVKRGPDTLRPEWMRVPYWFDGPQYEMLSAGIGPYALTRLARETGGAYFINDTSGRRSPFQLATMRYYMPDYSAAQEYQMLAQRSPLRRAVLSAVDLTLARPLKGTPRLEFAPTGNNFQDQLREAQETVAYNTLVIDRALVFFGERGLESAYEDEPSPRWRAWYDLTYGRLLAMRVRCWEYNWACAVMKGKGANFVDEESNRWTFHPADEIQFGTAAERTAAEARRLLQRCADNHPDTPWALLAQRELAHPFGFAIDEAYVAPPPPPDPNLNPGNPPDPQGRRTERARKLERPKMPDLPKL